MTRFDQATWWMRYALDCASDTPQGAIAVRSHGQAALTQHDAVKKAIDLAHA